MSFNIYASIQDGTPELLVCDANTGDTLLKWHYPEEISDTLSEKNVQELFRQLMLLTVRQEFDNVRVFSNRVIPLSI